MIVSLRGTNGAGKSTVVRSVMNEYRDRHPVTTPRKRRPIGYTLSRGDEYPELFVPGHYEIANGGLDTLHDLDWGYELIREFHNRGFDVLCEGMNMSDGVHRISELGLRFGADVVHVVTIQLPLLDCVRSVRSRGHAIKESTIARLREKTRREHFRLLSSGKVTAVMCDRATAATRVRSLLRLRTGAECVA